MIALITSTISPGEQVSAHITDKERYLQTLHTVGRLAAYNYDPVFLFDNSYDTELLESFKTEAGRDVSVFHNHQYAFKNKGINEALLILNNLSELPDNQPIFKISGRYYPTDKFVPMLFDDPSVDFIGKAEYLDTRNPLFSTRGYWVKNKKTLEHTLVLAIEEMISYSKGIHGPRSILNLLRSTMRGSLGVPYHISIESAFYRILKQTMNPCFIDRLHIEGYVAGSGRREFISE